MQAMETEMKIAQDQISARREEQERSVQSFRRWAILMIVLADCLLFKNTCIFA